jgi:uncharacterized membrane protein YgdD (TMEM256/DUF423 family)
MKHKFFIMWAAISGFIATCLGAFGAHALKARLSVEMLTIYQTAVSYHFYHSIALLLLGLLMITYNNKYLVFSGIMFGIGVLLFSGSLYMLAITEVKLLGMITPIGGVCLLIGWFYLAFGIYVTSNNA